MSVFFVVDDKHVPLYRVVWVAATPHFCGEDDCQREGYYEIRLEQGEYVNSKPIARLVIDDAIQRSKNFISKSRSQFDELNAFLRTAVRRPADAK